MERLSILRVPLRRGEGHTFNILMLSKGPGNPASEE